jgi:hypothetical protein
MNVIARVPEYYYDYKALEIVNIWRSCIPQLRN